MVLQQNGIDRGTVLSASNLAKRGDIVNDVKNKFLEFFDPKPALLPAGGGLGISDSAHGVSLARVLDD